MLKIPVLFARVQAGLIGTRVPNSRKGIVARLVKELGSTKGAYVKLIDN